MNYEGQNEPGHHISFSRWLSGERNDSWRSEWRKEFERRSIEDRGKIQYIPQIKARPKRAPLPPRFCASCPNRLNHGNKCGYCKLHTPKFNHHPLKKAA